MIGSGCALNVTVKYDYGENQTLATPKIVLEVIENDKEKRRIEVDDYYSPEHTAIF